MIKSYKPHYTMRFLYIVLANNSISHFVFSSNYDAFGVPFSNF